MKDLEQLEIKCAGALWDWLKDNHARTSGIWLVTFKKQSLHYVSREEVLDALIAYGWIDGRRKKLDDIRTMQLVSPRRQQVWADTYKPRAAKLEKEGRMKPPGRAAMATAKLAGTWDALSDVDALAVPIDLAEALDQQSASTWFSRSAPSYRRNVLRWIASAKTETTRSKRVWIVVDHAARGLKVPHY